MNKLSLLACDIICKRSIYYATLFLFFYLCIPLNRQHQTSNQQSLLAPLSGGSLSYAQAQQQSSHQAFVDSSTIKPSLILIVPQSLKVPTRPSFDYNDSQQVEQLQQYIAVINNAQDNIENEKIRQHYKRLSLQVRDADSPIGGQIFFEHVFDYFEPNSPDYLLIPIDLSQISFQTKPNKQHVPSDRNEDKLKIKNDQNKELTLYSENSANFANNLPGDNKEKPNSLLNKPQQLIVSIKPYQLEAGYGSDSIELVSSSPVLVEPVPSSDGRRSFATVQTDKPIYKPSEKVRIRAIVITENLRPVIGDEMRMQIKNPHKMIVEEVKFPKQFNSTDKTNEPIYLDHNFEFPPEPMLGTWSVHLLHNDPVANDTINFEVREYVLPPFEVTFESPEDIVPSTNNIVGALVAKYHYGKPVQGMVQFKFGFRMYPTLKTKFVARSNIKTINQDTGRVEYNISSDKFRETEWFPIINGARLVIEATVTEMKTGHRETAQDTKCLFINRPYRISFEDTIENFKPGLTQQLSVQLLGFSNQKPGPAGKKIVALYQDQNGTYISAAKTTESSARYKLDSEAVTDSNGKAIFNIGPIPDDITSITVTMKLLPSTQTLMSDNDKDLSKSHWNTGNELAIDHHTLVKHESHNGWISIMNKSVTSVNVGDQFISDLMIRNAMVLPQKIFFLIVVRGQIIALDPIDTKGLVSFNITEAMMPSFRLVLFALTHDAVGFVSDSMRINVQQDLECGLKLQYKSHGSHKVINGTIRPDDRGKLEVSARPGDSVSLIGVDNAVYSLNNRTRFESSRIIERIKLLDTGCGFGGGKNNLDVFHNAGLMFHKDVVQDIQASMMQVGSSCLYRTNQLGYVEEANMGYSKPMLSILNRAIEVAQRLKWSSRPRTKREVDTEAILKRYKDPAHKACCRLGTLEDIPQKRNCSIRRAIVEKYHQHAGSCSSIYYDCCRAVFGEPELKLSGMLPLNGLEPRVASRNYATLQQAPIHHTEPVISVGQLDKIEALTLVRNDFRETWLFDIVNVDANGNASLDVKLPHSISSWSISAIALNKQMPMCILPRPFKLNTFQNVFIKLSLPYKVVQGEQVDMVTTLFNYSPKNQDVLVYMYGIEDVCSDADPGERSELRRVRVDRHSSQALIFSLLPLKIGRYPIRVSAVTLGSNSSDIIEQQLNVVPRGKPVTDETTFSLDPKNQQRRSKRAIQTGNLNDEIDSINGVQRSKIRLTASRESEFIVPETQECIISAIGDKIGQSVQTSMLDVENLVRLPHGCGEQVMIYLGPTLYTAKYLNSIDKLTGDLRWRAIRYIQSGYKRILNFRKDSGAFSSFANRDASIWLTAYVTKILCQTERTRFIANEIYVDGTVVNSALNWLIDTQNKETGTWIEKNPVYHREMLGGVLRESALTAFVTITLKECVHRSLDTVKESGLGDATHISASTQVRTNGVDRLRLAIQRAEVALIRDHERAYYEKNPYVLAIVAYALSFSRPHEAASTFGHLMSLSDRLEAKNQIFWRGQYQIETAAYALQAIIELAPIISPQTTEPFLTNWLPGTHAVAISNWLSSRRSFSGSFESTQDTVVALEALSKFAQLQSTPNGLSLIPNSPDNSSSLSCNVSINNRIRRSLEFSEDNAQILQSFRLESFDLNPVNGEVLDIITRGSGIGTMSVRLKYNVFHEEDELCRFNIDSTIEEWQPPKIISNQDPANSQNNVNITKDKAQDESSSEDNLFKTFDKSMLNELNLINQEEINFTQDPTKRETDRNHTVMSTFLRTKRHTSRHTVDPSSKNNTAASESWSAKFVSNLKSRLPSWIAPKSPQEPSISGSAQMDFNITSDTPKRYNTSRRSTQTLIPAITPQSIISSEAHLNTLSQEFEISSQNKTIDPKSSSLGLIDNPARRLVLLLRVCAHHLSSKRDSEMAVIEVGILSGFKPNEADLKEILNDVGTPAMKYELSADRALVILYMKYIPNTGPYCFQFRLVRDSLVYNLQSGYIRVYEYYSPTHSCSNFYTPTRVNNLTETKCDASGQVCHCASRSLCPATKKLVDLGEISQANATSARNQLVDMVCSEKYDIVSLVRLKSVRYIEAGDIFKLSVKVKFDLKGNLTKIIDIQRQQKFQLIGSIKKPEHTNTNPTNIQVFSDGTSLGESEETSLDYLELRIDSSCVKNDPLLLHLAHPSQWKQGGELMILFARSNKLEKRHFKVANQFNGNRQPPFGGPRPKSSVFIKDPKWQLDEAHLGQLDDVQQQQYSLTIPLDKDTILHDVTYHAKIGRRESINNLILWLEFRSRREKLTCPS